MLSAAGLVLRSDRRQRGTVFADVVGAPGWRHAGRVLPDIRRAAQKTRNALTTATGADRAHALDGQQGVSR